MTAIDEALGPKGQGTPLSAALAAGLKTISLNAEVTFTKYLRLVLPLDGYLFWVRADLLSPSAKYATTVFQGAQFNQPQAVDEAAATFKARGSLHYSTFVEQREDATQAINKVIFTSLDPTEDLNAIRSGTLLIGEFEGLKFAFSQRRGFYTQANLQHYVGEAVYPDMETQLVDDPSQFDAKSVVVSNSLPIWLGMNDFQALPYLPFSNPSLPLYPSFVVPDDIRPPYAAVHVIPDSTTALVNAPTLGPTFSHQQLTTERVRVTLYGLRNYSALDFLDFVGQYSVMTATMGIMNSPVPRDEKRTQSELGTIAMKKSFDFEVNYYQQTARNVARQLVASAVPTYVFLN